MGDLPYKEYIPSTEELHLLKRDDPQVYKTYWEVLCHFYICAQVTRRRSGGVKQVSWANYLFCGLWEKLSLVSRLATSTDAEITERISESVTSYTTESNKDTFKADTVFNSFHQQARIPISDRALLAGFLMLWLKRCVVPNPPHVVIVADIVYLAILLAYSRPLGLLPTMVGCLLSGLWILCQSFCNIVAKEDREGNMVVGSDGEPRMKTPSLRVELPHT